MSLLGISGLSTLTMQLTALGLCLLFGILYRVFFRTGLYRQNPNLYFGTQTLILTVVFLLGSNTTDAFNFLFLLLAIHTALTLTGRPAVLWIATYYVIVSSIVLFVRGADGIYAVLFYLVAYVVCGFFGYVLRQAEQARDRNQKLLEELQAVQLKLQELAVVEERNRLARELHDSVKQQVFAISMQLSAARASLSENDKAFSSVIQAEKLAQQAGLELTTLIRELRPPNLENKSLTAALHEYVGEWSQQSGIKAELHIKGHPTLGVPVEQALFRVAQEAMSNVVRHSGAGIATVTLSGEDDRVMLKIEDNGIGFDLGHTQKGVGLDSMRERLEEIGGKLHISSQKDIGTQVVAELRRS